MDLDAVERGVREFLLRELRVRDAIAHDTPLMTSGLIDSIGFVRLAAFVERATGLRIPDRDVTVTHFDSLQAIRSYLAGRSNG